MVSLRSIKVSRVRLLAISVLICFTCVVTATYATASQLNLPNNTLILGIRTVASPIGKFDQKTRQYSGFCDTFGKTLERKLHAAGQNLIVERHSIANQYKGPYYARFYGLILGDIDVECGPNSIKARELIDPIDNEPFWKKITFSDIPFGKTGIRILIKKIFIKSFLIYPVMIWKID